MSSTHWRPLDVPWVLLLLISLICCCSAQDCPSSSVSLVVSRGVTCGSSFTATLSHTSSSSCPFSSGGALLCDSAGRNCFSCGVSQTAPNSLVYLCVALQTSGIQTLTGTYLIGAQIKTITATLDVGTCSGTPQPVAPQPANACDLSTIQLSVPPVLQQNTPFRATLSTTHTNCALSSGGAMLCHLGSCSSCSTTQLTSYSVAYNCVGPSDSQSYTLTGTFLLGSTTATKAASGLIFRPVTPSPSTPVTVPVTPTTPTPTPAPTTPPTIPTAPTAPTAPITPPTPPVIAPTAPITVPSPLPPITPPTTAPITTPVLAPITTPTPILSPGEIPPIYGPIAAPVVPPSPPPSNMGCNINTVSLVVNPPLYASRPFTAVLSTTGACPISSGGALICNSAKCDQCTVTQLTTYSLRYNCVGQPNIGIQDITAIYLLGDIYGRNTIKTLIFTAAP